ncbi:MAG: hypothetical protein JWM99_3671 [Verrucomicrobiales bacterium]|nr:hypothetical protein [Verrucomicrobiales bacterium]
MSSRRSPRLITLDEAGRLAYQGEPFPQALNTPRLHTAFDELAGKSNGEFPAQIRVWNLACIK